MRHPDNSLHGFNTAVLAHEKRNNAALSGASCSSEMIDAKGLFLISKDDTERPNSNLSNLRKDPKRRNRKTIIADETFVHMGKTYRINAKKSGVYTQILTRMIEQFEIAASMWSRVFIYRFDLHQDSYTNDNKLVSRFVKRISTKLKREYGFKKIGFCWVREQERAKAQHYHFVLFLDGRRIRHPKRLIEMIKQAWESPLGGFYMPYISRPFYFGTREEIAESVVYRISYMAKVRGKGYRPAQTKDYQTSRLTLSKVNG